MVDDQESFVREWKERGVRVVWVKSDLSQIEFGIPNTDENDKLLMSDEMKEVDGFTRCDWRYNYPSKWHKDQAIEAGFELISIIYIRSTYERESH